MFLAVIRSGSFTRAARRLGVNQSTISRRVAELEAALGCELFHRSTRTLEPTERALRLVVHAEAIEAAVVALEREAAEPDTPRGVVRVATPEELASGLLIPAFAELRQAQPDIRLELIGSGRFVDLERGEADIALRTLRPERGQLLARRLLKARYRAYANASYLEARSTASCAELTPEMLDWLALDDPLGQTPEARWINEGSAVTPILRTNDTLDLAAAAAAGLGATLLPESIAARHPELVPIWPSSPPLFERQLWLVVPRRLARVARVRAVMRWIEDSCKRTLV